MENGRFAFLSPLGGGLAATCDVHFKFIGKGVVDFLLVFIELFSLGATAEALRGDWKRERGTLKNAGPENAGLENAAPNCRTGKRGKNRIWKAK